MEECVICRERLLIPVELTCFGCFKKNTLSCSSLCRLCRRCAHEYLQLDRRRMDRDLFRRCLYCPSVCSVFRLTSETAYRKDFIMMRADTSSDHRCPYCAGFQGTQVQVDHHLDHECPAFCEECPCGEAVKKADVQAHRASCLYHGFCERCDRYILLSKTESHMMDEHELMKCGLCEQFIPFRSVADHIARYCRERLVRCDYCFQAVRYSRMAMHMEQHEHDFQERFHEISTEANSVLADYKRFRRARNRLMEHEHEA